MRFSELNPELQQDGTMLVFDAPHPTFGKIRIQVNNPNGWSMAGVLPDITLAPSVRCNDGQKMVHFNITNGEIVWHPDSDR